MANGHSESPLGHVLDHPTLEIPWGLGGKVVHLPDIPLLGGYHFQITRFMVMELLAAALMVAIFIPLARHMSGRAVTKGPFRNAFESLVLFIRDKVARPSIGGHGADEFVPFLLTVFCFILFNNLLGMVPGGASATGNINVTAVLAASTFLVVVAAGIRESGPVGFWLKLVPHMELPMYLKVFLWPLMFVIEVVGLFIRHLVLAIRLFANMLAGHIVLSVILGFTIVASGTMAYVVAPVSVMGVVMMSFLELLVAFLQAYIFTLLSALFIGSAVHPH
jgi:F-type H+-transporting ATPase subunit a